MLSFLIGFESSGREMRAGQQIYNYYREIINMAKQKKKQKTEVNMNKAVELTQSGARAALKGAVGTVEVSENYLQGIYNAGYDANVDALKVAKDYWDATTEIRKDWVKLFEETSEAAIDATAKMQVPYQEEVMDFGKGMYKSVSSTLGSFVPQTKTSK